MNPSLRAGLDILERQAFESVQRTSIENAPNIEDLRKREEVAKHPVFEKIRAVMHRMIAELDNHLHFGAHSVEEMYNDRGAVNALVEALNYFDTAAERRSKLQDTANEVGMGPPQAE